MKKQEEKDQQWDKLLKIRTMGRDASGSDQYRYPYEPTPYSVLERLANSGYIGRKNVLLDYGCGKGRVDFYLSYQTGCRTIGVEYNGRIFESAVRNQKTAVSGRKTEFVLTNAENYMISEEVNQCYFFNPFSVEILKSVLERISESYYEHPRKIQLFFYYPSDDYTGYLMTRERLTFFDEIDCRDLFEGCDTRERIMIFDMI